MRLTLSIFLLVCLPFHVRAISPEPVPLISHGGQRPAEWYTAQARLWAAATHSAPTDANAWRNYYLATEYSYLGAGRDTGEKERTLDRILAQVEKAIPESYEHYFIHLRRTTFADPKRKTERLEAALQRCPDCAELYADLATVHELTGQREPAAEMWTRLYDSQYLARGLLDYNYNMLMSTQENAILFTNGDNDTFPAWVLQRAREIRTDVLVLNLHLAQRDPVYLERQLRERGIDLSAEVLPGDAPAAFASALVSAIDQAAPHAPLYFALTVAGAFTAELHDRLYLVGLASRYTPRGIDNLGHLQYNLEHRFRLDYLTHDWYSEAHPATHPVVERLNTNYAYPFFLLADHYQASSEPDRAAHWRASAFAVANGNPLLLEQLQNRTIGKR